MTSARSSRARRAPAVIGQGGFGIVCLAHDLTLDRRVAIKKYTPSAVQSAPHRVPIRVAREPATMADGGSTESIIGTVMSV